MNQTILSKRESSLIPYAISKLNPEVFSHPVWVRFGRQGCVDSCALINELLGISEKLENDDPGGACQTLLVCTVYQNRAGRYFDALRTIHRILALAKEAHLAKETIWALWGACSISYLDGNHEQAETYLTDLQTALSLQHEWILADLIDVLRQSLWQSVADQPGTSPEKLLEDLVAFTSNWLQNWGDPQVPGVRIGMAARESAKRIIKRSTFIQSFFSVQSWQGHWRSLLLAIRGELNLQWTAGNGQGLTKHISPEYHPDPPARKDDLQTIELIPENVGSGLLPPNKAIAHAKNISRKQKPVSIDHKSSSKYGSGPNPTAIPIAVHMLGSFGITIGDLKVNLPASRGLSVFKYLLLHHKQYTSREMLMDIFWPEAETRTARNNLNVAMHGLRKALRSIIFLPVIVFVDGAYHLQNELQVWLDVEEFERCAKSGQRLESQNHLSSALAEFETAISLYQGDFLEENPYEEWTILDRERLRISYLETLDHLSQIYFNQGRYAACIASCQMILTRDRCREDAHRLLMCCYSRQEQYHLAVRQYQICHEALRSELKVKPALETTQLYDCIRRHEYV